MFICRKNFRNLWLAKKTREIIFDDDGVEGVVKSVPL